MRRVWPSARATAADAGADLTRGASNGHADAALIKRAMLERPEENVLVLDHTKFSGRHPNPVCALADVDDLLCDTQPATYLQKALAQANVDVRWLEG